MQKTRFLLPSLTKEKKQLYDSNWISSFGANPEKNFHISFIYRYVDKYKTNN